MMRPVMARCLTTLYRRHDVWSSLISRNGISMSSTIACRRSAKERARLLLRGVQRNKELLECSCWFSSMSNSASPPPTMQPLDEYQCVENDSGDDKAEAALVQAVQPYFDQQQPLVLRGMLMTSSAKNRTACLEKFPRFDQYWRQRLVVTTDDGSSSQILDCMVELGGNYSKSQVVEIPFDQFLRYLDLEVIPLIW